MKRDLPDRSFQFAVRITRLCKHLDEKRGVSRILMNQLLRSGTSIGANIEEGQAGQSEADFASKYNIALKECRETHYWLRLIAETDIISTERLGELTNECNELTAILTSILKKVRRKKSEK